MQAKYLSPWKSEWWKEQIGADTSQATEVIFGTEFCELRACTANYPHSLM